MVKDGKWLSIPRVFRRILHFASLLFSILFSPSEWVKRDCICPHNCIYPPFPYLYLFPVQSLSIHACRGLTSLETVIELTGCGYEYILRSDCFPKKKRISSMLLRNLAFVHLCTYIF